MTWYNTMCGMTKEDVKAGKKRFEKQKKIKGFSKETVKKFWEV